MNLLLKEFDKQVNFIIPESNEAEKFELIENEKSLKETKSLITIDGKNVKKIHVKGKI
jgi:small nuclear ribonucleoprotein (snRNP)-like protein